MNEATFRKAMYYAVRECMNNDNQHHIDEQHDALIRQAIDLVENSPEFPYPVSKVESEALAECANRRFGSLPQARLFV